VIPVHNQFAARPAGDLGLKKRGDSAGAIAEQRQFHDLEGYWEKWVNGGR
jgi:hypothetical protein